MWWFFLVACNRGNEVDGPSCEETETALAAGAASPLGFGAEAIDALLSTAPIDDTLTWADGGTTPVHLTFAPTGAAWFIDSQPAAHHGDLAPICAARVEVEQTLAFATDDGAFDETWTVRASAATADAAAVHRALDLAALQGTFDLVPFVTATGYDALSAWIDGTFTGGGFSTGEIAGQASGADPCDPGDTCSAWAENVPVGAWGIE